MRRALVAVAAATTVLTSGAGAARAPLEHLVPPRPGHTYFGFTFRLWDTPDLAWGDTRPFETRIGDAIAHELGGKRPTFLTVWAPWQDPDRRGKPLVPFAARLADVEKVNAVTGGRVLYLDWNLARTTAENGGVTVADVAAGRLDDYVRRYGVELAAYGRPVLVRLFNGEFDGDWWYGVSPRANPSLTPATFVAAWRRVVDGVRAAGARNVSWAWIPTASPRTRIAPYYPGDSYVDWAGADVYDYKPVSALDEPYAFARAHRKPFFLAEWGIRDRSSGLTPRGQRAWLGAMFDWVAAHPRVGATNYFDYDNRPGHAPLDPRRVVFLEGGRVAYQRGTNDYDHRLLADSGAGFRSLFARRIASVRYASRATTAP